MKKSRYSDSQILAILNQAEAGTPVSALCREHGMSSATFYKWRAKYGGMDASLMTRLKQLETENRRLKKMYADERLKAEIIQEAMVKKWRGHLSDVRWPKKQLLSVPSASGLPVLFFKSVKRVTAINGNCRQRISGSPIG